MVKQIKKQFSAATKPRCSHHNKNYLPSRDFEAHAGITGISANYKFPYELSATKYAQYLYTYAGWDLVAKTYEERILKASSNPSVMRQLRKDWDEVVALNPELKRVPVSKEDGGELRGALFGAVSQFSPDDMDFFTRMTRKPGAASLEGLEVLKKFGLEDIKYQIELTSGVYMYWVVAPVTLDKIKSALEAKTGTPLEWAYAPEVQKRITSYLSQKWTGPGYTPEQTAALKYVLAGPVSGWINYLDAADRKKIKTIVNKKEPAQKTAPKPVA